MTQANSSNFANIRKESDFQDFLKYETPDSIERLHAQLNEAVQTAGTTRSLFTDFLRDRIGQIGRALASTPSA